MNAPVTTRPLVRLMRPDELPPELRAQLDDYMHETHKEVAVLEGLITKSIWIVTYYKRATLDSYYLRYERLEQRAAARLTPAGGIQ